MKKILVFGLATLIGVVVIIHSCNNLKTIASDFKLSVDSTYEITSDPAFAPLAMRLDSLFCSLQKKNGYNCSVLIARGDKILIQKGYGFSDYHTKDALNKHTSFQLASVSKPITATAILILWERGKIDINKKVSDYIEGFPYDDITVEMLLDHRSGLPNYMHFCDQYVNDKTGHLTNNEDIINILGQYKPALMFKPGQKFTYSNTNYCLLASIIERVSGKSFSEFLQQEIFNPLKMSDSFVLTDKPLHNNIAQAYTHGFAALSVDYLDGVVGDKGIYSSVADLYKFHIGLDKHILLKKETLDAAYAPRSFEKRGERNYGYGWRMKKQSGGSYLIYHNGWWRGFNTLFFRRLSDGTVVIILNNKLNKGIYRITPILEILDGYKTDFETEDEHGNVTMLDKIRASKA